MKTLYFDCGMGAAGDMLAGALLELLPDRQAFVDRINGLGIPGVTVRAEPSVKCGVTGTHYAVTVQGAEEEDHHGRHSDHSHGSMADITALIRGLPVSGWVRDNALEVYQSIAHAESRVHGVPVSQVHFHEVGAMDAVADVVSVCMLLEALAPDRVLASPVHVGSGHVFCAHGILPVPAPATALLLEGVPVYGGQIQGELCTPTGAALLKRFVTGFGDLPPMTLRSTGYGMGRKDFPMANCVRAFLGDQEGDGDRVWELRCNLDDMTPEAIGFAMEALFSAGALDVWTTAIGMKKSRPGVLLSVLCRQEDRENMVRQLLRHTTTLGVRESLCGRRCLSRREEVRSTPWGPVREKISQGWDVTRRKPEYEDLSRIARETGLSLEQVRQNLEP